MRDNDQFTTPVPQLDSDPTLLREEACPECGEPAVVERSKDNQSAGDIVSVRCSNYVCIRFEPGTRPWTTSS